MIVLRKGETLRRRYEAKIKEFGKGTWYLTDKRMSFESSKHGMVFDLSFDWIFDWKVSGKKSVRVRWQEPETGFDHKDPKHTVEIEFGKKDGKKIIPLDVHMAIYYAYTDYYPAGKDSIGLYLGEDGEVRNRFYSDGRAIPKGVTMSDSFWRVRMGCSFFLLKKGQDRAPSDEESSKKLMEDYTGETLIEQEAYEKEKMWDALKADGSICSTNGVYTQEMIERYNVIKEEDLGFPEIIRKAKDNWEEKIKNWEKEDNRTELEKIYPGSKPSKYPNYTQSVPNNMLFQGGTVYDMRENSDKQLKVYTRLDEIILGQKFDFTAQRFKYEYDLMEALAAKAFAGEDISNYTPEIERLESAIPAAKAEIAEHRKKLVEAV